MMPKSLFGRSLILLIAPLLLAQLVSTFVFLDRHLDSVTKLLANNIAAMVQTLLLVKDPSLQNTIGHDYFHLHYEFLPKKKISPLPPPTSWAEAYLIDALNERLPTLSHQISIDDQNLVIDVETDQGVLHVRLLRKRLFTKTTPLFFFWAAGVSVLCLAIASVIMRQQLRPLQKLAKLTEDFGKGREVPNVRLKGATEIRQVTEAFNIMKNRIKRQVEQRTEMLAGISHDLRTPLTRMKLELEMSTPSPVDLKKDLQEMERMIQEYLDFVRSDLPEPMKNMSVALLLKDVTKNFSHVQIKGDVPFFMMGRPHALKRCMMNIVDNACRYATKVQISVLKNDQHIDIIVDDDGPGIALEDREDVFKPFYRLESSRNVKTGGVGLGLSIVQDMIHNHGGRTLLENSPLGGLRVRLVLPV